jgi:hypothetical protein
MSFLKPILKFYDKKKKFDQYLFKFQFIFIEIAINGIMNIIDVVHSIPQIYVPTQTV